MVGKLHFEPDMILVMSTFLDVFLVYGVAHSFFSFLNDGSYLRVSLEVWRKLKS